MVTRTYAAITGMYALLLVCDVTHAASMNASCILRRRVADMSQRTWGSHPMVSKVSMDINSMVVSNHRKLQRHGVAVTLQE